MQITVRKATASDYTVLCDLFSEIDALHRDHLPHLFRKPDGPAREYSYYLSLLSDEQVGLFVIEAGKTLVGFAHVLIRDAPPIPILVPRRFAVIDSIAVKTEFQNQGLGRRLMEAMHEWAVENGATSIELNVYEFNQAAIAFYQRLGYNTLSRRMSKSLDRK